MTEKVGAASAPVTGSPGVVHEAQRSTVKVTATTGADRVGNIQVPPQEAGRGRTCGVNAADSLNATTGSAVGGYSPVVARTNGRQGNSPAGRSFLQPTGLYPPTALPVVALRRSAAFTPHVPAGSRFVRPVLEYCRPVGSRCRHRRDRTPRCLHRHGRAVHQPPRRRPIILRQPEEDGFARYAPWGPRPISILEPLTNRTESNKNSMCGVFGQATA